MEVAIRRKANVVGPYQASDRCSEGVANADKWNPSYNEMEIDQIIQLGDATLH